MGEKVMSCQEFQNRTVLDLSGDLSPREAADLQAHLAVCADCRRFRDEMEASWNIVQSWKKAIPQGEEECLSQMRHNIRAGTRFSRRLPFLLQYIEDLFPLPVYRPAAVLVAIALLAAAIWLVADRPTETKVPPARPSADLLVPKTVLPSREIGEVAKELPARTASVVPVKPRSDKAARAGLTDARRNAAKMMVAQASDHPLGPAKAFRGRIELQTADPNIRIIWLASR